MLFDIHMFSIAGLVMDMRTLSNIVAGLQILQGFVSELETLLEAAKG